MPDLMQDQTMTLPNSDIEDANRILLQLNSAIKNSHLYPPEHPRIRDANISLLKALQDHIAERGEITLRFIENQIILNKTPLCEIGGAASGLIESCLDRQIQSITFSQGLRLEELTEFTKAMTESPEELTDHGGIQEEILSRNVSHISVGKLVAIEQSGESSDGLERRLAREIYKRAFSEAGKAMEEARSGHAIPNTQSITEVINDMIDCLSRSRSALLGLTSARNYDQYTLCHSVNVSILSLALGISISLRRELLERLGIGGLLHDIGKVLIPDSILDKPGKLNREELAIIQQHPINGARILRNTTEMPENAAIVAFEHHINYDLSGYPSLVRRRPLSVYSMTVRIADYYDAMTALRPYRKPMMPADVLKCMPALSGRDFEPRLLSQFVKVLGTYPVGSLVRLDTNELAIVYSVNSGDPERPVVKLIAVNKDRQLIPGEVVDLREQSPGTEQYQRSVIQVLNPISKGMDMMDFL